MPDDDIGMRAEKRASLQTETLLGVEKLTRAVETNTVEVMTLRHDVQSESEARHWRARALQLLAAAVGGAMIVLPYVVVQQRQNHRQQQQIVRVVSLLIECTTPDEPKAKISTDRVHECYDRSQEQQRQAVKQLIDAIEKRPAG